MRQSLKRTLIVLWKIIPIILSFVRDFKQFIFWGTGRSLSDDEHRQRAKKLTHTLGDLGPTFIKLAQVLSARADVLQPMYIQELSTLQDKVNPNPTQEITAIIQKEFEQSVEQLFDSFEKEPIAAASLGQVHRATYHGADVIVKVLRPGVFQVVHIDLHILFGILRVLNTFISYSPFLRSFTTVLTEFRRVIQEEMDFELEARNVKIFQQNLQHEEWVVIPKVYDEFTTKRVIVLEYLKGVKINQVETLERMGIDIDLVIQRLAKIYIHQVMIDGFLHADPHPGNILVDQKGRILILDFGMVIRIDESFKLHLIKYAIAQARNDVDAMVDELYELQLVEPGTNKAMLRELSVLMLEIQEQGKISARKVQQMGNAMINAFYQFPFTLPSELVYTIRATSLIEGIGLIHDPWFDAVAVGKPIIKDMAQEIFQQELQGDLLETLQRWAMQSYQTLRAFQDTIIKLDREELRLHLHPIDIQSISTIMGGVARRILGGVLALLLSMVCSAIYLRGGDTFIFSVGIISSVFVILFLLLLPNKTTIPKRHHYWQKQLGMATTEDGELYKSFVMNQMSREEREQMEAQKQEAESRKQ